MSEWMKGFSAGVFCTLAYLVVVLLTSGCSTLDKVPIDRVPNELKVVEYITVTNTVTNYVPVEVEVPGKDRYYVVSSDNGSLRELAAKPDLSQKEATLWVDSDGTAYLNSKHDPIPAEWYTPDESEFVTP